MFIKFSCFQKITIEIMKVFMKSLCNYLSGIFRETFSFNNQNRLIKIFFCQYLDFEERGAGMAATTICLFEKNEFDAHSFWKGLALVTCLNVWDPEIVGNWVALTSLEGSEGSKYKDNILLGIWSEEWSLASFSSSTCWLQSILWGERPWLILED